MVEIVQTLGIAYLLFMVYLSFLYYKRNNYSLTSFVFWVVVWSAGALLLVIPQSISALTQRISVARVIDFYLILGLMFFSIVCFVTYAAVKRNEAKIEDLVRRLAIEDSKPKRKR